ncbi:MAG: excinuclease ABC subunit UvrA [gamma proteobacterium symbiont of Bathyaustriella thionipta]|nr:excinuclease ABC subunit UvrA [gamma proteobacterium symbiont of Bathyaustriella thionipta]MCU7949036.1 excinuclease ABC subunit UvrA [gamma proteobacterium symbiont of Bathyaustriella thionipta]MCU7952563.1 excinuclease ABC subunit UvrA [gamma proteobacterium symbiont of Bathyaustriella thionipta]MCU7955643.1 excinuclease ABC subunit UvrA [gamma proteobacterium symbiont of Bathyaustriella thionipta]MCU7968113.1 excinuclease ABC subunit UvrA [gamma proteobacterium symbiont of Bathyaustriella
MDTIKIQGARTHNLKNIDIELPRDKLIVITGLSGSGKSSLAFDTIYAEGQRRYVESLSSYARQFLSMMEKPDIDHIEGLSPAISIEQKSTSYNPRSTVGTVTEIYDYLRLLFARVGTPRCPEHHTTLDAQTVSQMVDRTLELPEGSKLMLLAPVIQARKGEHHVLFDELRAQGFIRARIDGELYELDQPPALELHKKHTIEVVIDRFKVRPDLKQRLADSFETALELSSGIARIAYMDDTRHKDVTFSAKFACPECGYSLTELEPRLFSFNNPAGACSSCDGLGVKQFFDPAKVVHQSEQSLTSGAIRGWDRRNAYYFQMLTSLAKHYNFDIETPYSQLPKKIQTMILYGNNNETINFVYINDKGRKTTRNAPFEGVIHNMQRRYHETDSNVVREELSKYQTIQSCPECHGSRLNLSARNVFINKKTLPEVTSLSIGETQLFFESLKLTGKRGEIAKKIIIEISQRLDFLVNVGLEYLTLDRSAETLSGGEAQRIRLASQIGAGLVGVMYILDEPSIGLHQRDNQRLLNTLTYLRDLGNTVIVVEHDEDAIRSADYIVDIGPGAGVHGGEIVAQGQLKDIINNKQSITAQFLNGTDGITVPEQRTQVDYSRLLKIIGATGNNLKRVNVTIPVGLLTVVTGVSGSGKSTLINDTLYKYAASELNRANTSPAPFKSIEGIDHFDKVIDIDQSPIGRTPRSNPATYTGLFTSIRDLFTATNEARSRGYTPGRFSFNVKGGRCEACQGDGVIKVEMHFLPDIYVPCDVCKGKRYNRETLEIKYKGKNIYQILDMTIEEAHHFFSAIPALKRKLQTLLDVGLSYIKLGQSATTLSGGEAQRVKLSKELSKRDTGKTLYILDEPTTGLHFFDIKQLLQVLFRLRDHGNTVVIIEHNLDVIKTADWLIDIGPEGGNKGGEIIACTTPEKLVKKKNSYTGEYLRAYLK